MASAHDHAPGELHRAEGRPDRRSASPYAPETLGAGRGAFDGSAPIIALTDGPLSPLLPLAKVAFEIEDAELQGFRRCPPLCVWR
jgi:DNA-binding MurR/RpiR family transcriptional regulator